LVLTFLPARRHAQTITIIASTQEAKLQVLMAEMQAVKLAFDRGFLPQLSAVQFARLVTVTPYLTDVNALGIAVGAGTRHPDKYGAPCMAYE